MINKYYKISIADNRNDSIFALENKITTIVRKLRKDCKVSSFIQEAPVQESIKSALQQKPLTKIELVKITGRTYKSIETALTKMKKNNLVLNQNGLWFLV